MKKRIVLLLAVLLLVLSGCGADSRDYPMGERISNAGAVVRAIRYGLANHSKAITVRFSYGSNIYGELNEVIRQWVEAALEETDSPTEGDYIRYQYGGYEYSSSYTVQDGRYDYTVVMTPGYYCWNSEEVEASEAAKELLRSFGFRRSTTDYEKAAAIYGWLCRNVQYDKVHRKNPYYHKCSTAYAALVQKTATCQGYCTALYRLLKSSGIDCRIVTGTAGEEDLHAWVIAGLDGLYYQLDPTWDAGKENYDYFLVGTDSMTDRIPDEPFRTEAFLQRYPPAENAADPE